ncbi:LexA family protein [Acinetobacter soli]|uniref:LexA family protein n=1 Tax=Acinetobacter soli TaxID=487316 RepID=UPI001F327270|nr:XRE family transcriptional regulator [Acinetobacter soli]MCE6007469.1 XRE family transcriptional regulator [Acinetobacter soli]WOQ37656.1 XRE family transcriptional regulator [Acinetobacter soli]
MKMGLGYAIKALREKKGLSQEKLAEHLGKDKGNISRYEKGKQAPSIESLEVMAKVFGVTVSEIFKIAETKEEPNIIALPKQILLPVLSWVQAGLFNNVESIDVTEVSEWLPAPDEGFESCFYLKVKGVSMEKDFYEGDYILVDPTVFYSDMQSEDLIIVRKGTDATFKQLVIESDDAKYLKALNPNFTPNIIPIDEECHFVGQVVDSVRRVYKAKRRSKIN